MATHDRRHFLKSAAKLAAAAPLVQCAPLWAEEPRWLPEKGASLRMLRWKRAVQGDEDMWVANTRRFTQLTGVEVRIDSENFEEVRPKAAVAANVGAGPDIIIATNEDHFQYPS